MILKVIPDKSVPELTSEPVVSFTNIFTTLSVTETTHGKYASEQETTTAYIFFNSGIFTSNPPAGYEDGPVTLCAATLYTPSLGNINEPETILS